MSAAAQRFRPIHHDVHFVGLRLRCSNDCTKQIGTKATA